VKLLAGVGLDPGRAGRTSWRAYAVRFVFGGVVTACTGLVAHAFGPAVGGLFLAFPAILPASITLIEDREGKRIAADDCAGAVLGSVGLLAFGAVVWALAPRLAAWQVLGCATVAWLAVAVALWRLLAAVTGEQTDGGQSD